MPSQIEEIVAPSKIQEIVAPCKPQLLLMPMPNIYLPALPKKNIYNEYVSSVFPTYAPNPIYIIMLPYIIKMAFQVKLIY